MKPLWKKIGKTVISLSVLAILIIPFAAIIALLLKVVFGVAVKE